MRFLGYNGGYNGVKVSEERRRGKKGAEKEVVARQDVYMIWEVARGGRSNGGTGKAGELPWPGRTKQSLLGYAARTRGIELGLGLDRTQLNQVRGEG